MNPVFPKKFLLAGKAILILFLVGYLLVLLLLYLFQESILFYPEKLPADYTFRFSSPAEEKWLEIPGGKVNSLLFRGKADKGILLYLHGNAGSLAGWGHAATELLEGTGWTVWIVDYPGFGKSEGSLRSEDQFHQTADALYAAARKEYGPDRTIVVYGRSIGSGASVRLASQNPVKGLILESPYFSLRSLVSEKVPWVPIFLLRYQLRSDEWMPKLGVPLLVVHGLEDTLIPADHGKRLSELSGNAKFLGIPGAGHNNPSSGEAYWKTVQEFLNKI